MLSSWWYGAPTNKTPIQQLTESKVAHDGLIKAIADLTKLKELWSTDSPNPEFKEIDVAAGTLEAECLSDKLNAYLDAKAKFDLNRWVDMSQVTPEMVAATPLLDDKDWTDLALTLIPVSLRFGFPAAGTRQYKVSQLFWTLWKAFPIKGLKLVPADMSSAHTWSRENNRDDRGSVLDAVNHVRQSLLVLSHEYPLHGFALCTDSIGYGSF
jgi:hypothetical protein